MSDTGNADQNGNDGAEQAPGISPQTYSARAPSEREIAERDNEQVAKNRNRFIYRPFRLCVKRPFVWTIRRLNKYGDAVTAAATFAIAVLTGVLAWYANEQGTISENQRAVMQGQLDEMKAEQRPWVYADFKPGGAFYKTQSNGIGIPVAFFFHNTGHLPALYVSPDIEAYLSGEDDKIGSTTVRERQKRRCEQSLQQPNAPDQIGVTVFPGQNVPFSTAAGIGAAKIVALQQLWRDKLKKEMDILAPWITGCIRYRSPDGVSHQTGIAFTVEMTRPDHDGLFALFALPADPTAVDVHRIVFTPWIVGGTAYAY